MDSVAATSPWPYRTRASPWPYRTCAPALEIAHLINAGCSHICSDDTAETYESQKTEASGPPPSTPIF